MRKFALVSAMLVLLTAQAFSQPAPTSASTPDRFADSEESIERNLNDGTKGIAETRERRKRCETDQCRIDYDQAIEGQLQAIILQTDYRLARMHHDPDVLGIVTERYRAAQEKARELNNKLDSYNEPVPTCSLPLPCARH